MCRPHMPPAALMGIWLLIIAGCVQTVEPEDRSFDENRRDVAPPASDGPQNHDDDPGAAPDVDAAAAGGDRTPDDDREGPAGESNQESGDEQRDDQQEMSETDDNALASGYAAPAAVVDGAISHVSLAVEAVFLASRLTGGQQLVTTGTLTQLEPNSTRFSYSDAPNDRLRAELIGEPPIEFIITLMEGDFSGEADDFLGGPHDLSVRVIITDQVDVEYTSRQWRDSPLVNRGPRQQTARGSFVWQGTRYEADVRSDGTYSFEIDNTGFEFRTQSLYAGTITTDGYLMNVDESWDYISVSAVMESGGQRISSSSTRTLNNTWTVNGVEYRYDNAVIQTALRNGRPIELDTTWLGEGELLRNGEAYGRLELGIQLSFVKVWLVLPDRRIELQSWR